MTLSVKSPHNSFRNNFHLFPMMSPETLKLPRLSKGKVIYYSISEEWLKCKINDSFCMAIYLSGMSYRCHERFSLYGSIWGVFDNAPDLVDNSCPPFREGIVGKSFLFVCMCVFWWWWWW